MQESSTVVLTYGVSGIGKTTDQGYSFPRALFVAAPGALTSITGVCGYTPAQTQVATIEEGTKLIKEVAGKFDWIVFDDFSFLAEQTFSAMEKKKSGFKLWGALRDLALDFRDTARYAKVHVILNAWEQPPKNAADGSRIRGGPALSGKLPEQIPAMCDIVLRAIHEPKRRPWPAAYRCAPDQNWVLKDRFNIVPRIDPAPMNLGEILRAAGVEVHRHPDLPEQEDFVAAFAAKFSEAEGFPTALANEFFTKLRQLGWPAEAAKWTLRDALDRAEIQRALRISGESFISDTGVTLL